MDWRKPPCLRPDVVPAENPFHQWLKRLNSEIKRRTDVVGNFPSEAAIARLIGALLLEQNDARAQRGPLHGPGAIAPLSNDPIVKLPVLA
jgi:putative transposase